MGNLFVIGCASLDVIHVERDGSRLTYQSPGGAALYTALAARGSGIDVTLVAPRPNPMPESLHFVDECLDWIGPECEPNATPTLEIVHHGGGKATLLNASWGAEKLLSPDHLPAMTANDIVHVAALSAAQSQQNFLEAAKQSNSGVRVSVGTYARLVQASKEQVAQLLTMSDFFFMNSNEFGLLIDNGSTRSSHSGQKIFVTDGAQGATIYDGETIHKIQTIPAVDFDPTGAGDTFCGVTLGEILRGVSVEDAARSACIVASQSVEQVGPAVIKNRIA